MHDCRYADEAAAVVSITGDVLGLALGEWSYPGPGFIGSADRSLTEEVSHGEPTSSLRALIHREGT